MDRLTLITTPAGDFIVADSPADVRSAVELAREQGEAYVELAQPRLAWQTADDTAESITIRAAAVIAVRLAPPMGRVAPASMLGLGNTPLAG